MTTYAQGQALSVVTNGYDVVGTLIAQGGDTYPVTFGYDTSGRRTQLTTLYGEADASASTQWKYCQATGLLTNKLDAANKGAAYTYTTDGRPLRTTWARSNVWKENVYDERGLVCSNRYSSSSMDVSCEYNAAGLPSLVTSALGFATAYAYNDALVLTNETVSGLDAPDSGFGIARTIDDRQRPASTSLSHNGTNLTQVLYGYDAENRFSAIDHVDATVEYTYTGRYMTGCTIALSNGPVFTRTFVRDAYRKHLINAVSNTFDGVSVHSTAYDHDLLSRRTNIVMTAQTGTNILSCAYNARNEVTGVSIDTNDYSYIYDNIGNSLYTSLNTVTNVYTVNNLNQYKAITNLLDLTGYRLQHDDEGNTTRIGEHSLYYDAENRLVSYMFGLDANEVGTVRMAYAYDHLGRRVRKLAQEYRVYAPGGITPPTYWWHTNEVTTFVYDGWNLIHERVAHTNGTVDEIEYVWGLDLSGTRQGAGGVGGLLFEKRNGAIYIPCYDANGNITAYIDTNGTVRAYRVYDAFGNTIAKGGDMVDVFHFWFSTKYLDHDTGLYYYGMRYYSPMLQRWLNRDPIEESGGLNMYGFCGNEALNKSDLLGMMSTVTWNNDMSIRWSAFFQLGRALLDFFDGGASVTYNFEYPDSVSKRFLEHSKVKPIWKDFKKTTIADYKTIRRYEIAHVASKLDFFIDMKTLWELFGFSQPFGYPLVPDMRNIKYLDFGTRVTGSFVGRAEISVESSGSKCVKTLDMTLSDHFSIESLFRNPFTRNSTVTKDYLSPVTIKVNYLIKEPL